MNNKKIYPFIFILLAASSAAASSEGLDELAARKDRLAQATWDNTTFEDATTFVWQPETLMYVDSVTKNEVWRLTTTKDTINMLPDLNHSGWSADGKRFVFGSQRDTRAFTSTYEAEYEGIVMMMRADGSLLRTLNGGPFRVFVHSRYFNWSPVAPDVYYGFGRNYAGERLSSDDLYKVTVSDLSQSMVKVFDLNSPNEVSLTKSFSPDGTTLRAAETGKYYFFSLTDDAITLTNPGGWASARQLDTYWGGTHTPADTNYTMHYSGVVGVGANKKLYFMPEGYNSVWSYELSGGTATDGGPEHTVDHTPPYDWGGIRPVVSGDMNGGVCHATNKTPWCCDGDTATDCDRYMSHNTYDRWGKHMLAVNAQVGDYWAVWDLVNHKYVNDKIPTQSTCDWHTDWNAWSDYFATSSASIPTKGLGGIYTSKYDGSVIKKVASAHLREAGSTSYDSLPRVTQSPDGTKLIFHSDFLSKTANTWDIFYAVAYYPHPPEVTSVTNSSGVYTVRFDWRLGTATPRGYTKRGWPNEATDNPPPPRETKLFRLWRTCDKVDDWKPLGTVNADIFSRYDFSTGRWTGNDYWEFTDDSKPSGTCYYAVTAQEHSGLESRTLSNVFSETGAQTAEYPSDPKGTKPFYLVAPKWPSPKPVSKLSTPGQYRLDWEEPANAMIRYYNIYYSTDPIPKAIQSQRIASVPKGTNTYVDWLAHPTSEGHYLITSVDTQGNESSHARRELTP